MDKEYIRGMFENVACLARGGHNERESQYIDNLVNHIMKLHNEEIEKIKKEINHEQA